MGLRGMGEASVWARAVARAVAELRDQAGLTVPELARRIDRDPSYLYGRLNGSAPFNVNDWEFLARALGVHPLEIARLAAKYTALDDEDLEPTIKTDPEELTRRIRLLESSPRLTGLVFDAADLLGMAADREIAITADQWSQLRAGTAGKKVPVRVLSLVAEYTGVPTSYLTELDDKELADKTEAQLELRSAIREIGADSVLARSVSEVSPEAIRAIAASLKAAHRGSPD